MARTAPRTPPRGRGRSELAERAAALFPLLRANAEQTEAQRRVVEASIEALTDAGLFRVSVPGRYGGLEADIATTLEVSEEVGRACGSTGWVVGLCNVCAWVTALLPERGQDEVFAAGPDTRICGVLTPRSTTTRVEGGLRVSGTWDFCSGCLHASWALLGAPLLDEGGEPAGAGLVWVPMSEVEIRDTWFVAGMKGTGSNTIVAEDVFVPDHRILPVVGPAGAIEGNYRTERIEEPLYRSAFVPVLALVLAGPQLGLARAALETVLEKLPRRAIMYTTYERQAEAPVTHLQVAEAASKIDTARLHAYRSAADIDDAAEAGVYPDLLTRARVRMDTGYAARTAREAVEILVAVSGASGMADSSPIQRILRDITTANLHAIVQPSTNQELYGRVLCGLEPAITPFF